MRQSAQRTQPATRDATILFVDVGGSVAVSASTGMDEYDNFVRLLHETYASILKTYRIDEHSREKVVQNELVPSMHYQEGKNYESLIAGDQLFMCLHSDQHDLDITCALNVAIETKVRWLQREPNLSRVRQGLPPFPLFAGLHCGRVLVRLRPESLRSGMRAEGYAINLAKRIEGLAREGEFMGIFCSEDFRSAVARLPKSAFHGIPPSSPTYHFAGPTIQDLKGVGKQRLYELKACIPHTMVITKKLYQDPAIPAAMRANPHDFITLSYLARFQVQQHDQVGAQATLQQMCADAQGSPDLERFVRSIAKALGLSDDANPDTA